MNNVCSFLQNGWISVTLGTFSPELFWVRHVYLLVHPVASNVLYFNYVIILCKISVTTFLYSVFLLDFWKLYLYGFFFFLRRLLLQCCSLFGYSFSPLTNNAFLFVMLFFSFAFCPLFLMSHEYPFSPNLLICIFLCLVCPGAQMPLAGNRLKST